MYRVPRQQRSRERFDRILVTAAAILAEDGFDGLTTNRVAEQAGIPIGSVYQFFPDKQAIVAALTDRYLAEVDRLCEDQLTVEAARKDLGQFIGRMIDGIAELQAEHSGFLCIFSGGAATGPYADLAKQLRGTIAGHLDRVLAEVCPDVPKARRRLVLKTMADTSAAMIGSIDGEKEKERPVLIEEMKSMLGLYVASRLSGGA